MAMRTRPFASPGLSRRAFCSTVAATAAAALSGCRTFGAGGSGKASCRNILLITTDDQGVEAGCYGDPFARTPYTDALAAEGVRFDRAYITQASCSPSRSSMLTGLFPHQNGQTGLARPDCQMHPGVATLQGVLKEAGFKTGILGKLHVAPDEAFPLDMDGRPPGAAWTRDVRKVAEDAGEFFAACGEDPFFLMVNYFDPHRPFDDEANQYMGLPEDPVGPDDIEPLPFLGVDSGPVRQEVAAYYNCISRLDTGMGLLLEALERAGRKDDTIVIFLGDHGAPMTRAKTTCYEAGVHVPFIVRWPGVSYPGSTSDDFVSAVDIMPTALEAVGVPVPAGLAGRSLRPLCAGTPVEWRDTICTEYASHAPGHYYPRRAVFNGRYKLIRNLLPERRNPVPNIGPARIDLTEEGTPARAAYETHYNPPAVELYDIREDPIEFHNLAGDPALAEVEERLQAALRAWQVETDDPLLDPRALAALTRQQDARVGN